jgi:pimeloyl-ACP methyl ester carboxylesterase
MKKFISVMKSVILIVTLGLGLAFCQKNVESRNSVKDSIDYHQAAVTQFITAGQTKFAYRVLGQQTGIPLVMLASLGSSMDEWDPAVTDGLAQQYKVIIFDNQGVGSSTGVTPDNIPDMATAVVDFVHALGYTKVNLLGFSMGSFISEQILLTNPALVNKVILTGTGPRGAEGLSNLPNLLKQTAGLSPEQTFLVSHFTQSVESQAAGKLSFERIIKRQANRDSAVTNASAYQGLKAVLAWAQPYPDAFTELGKISKPVLIVQGKSDLLVPVVNAYRLANSIPGAKLIIYSDAGHGSLYQYHDQFVQATIDFLGN